MNKNLETIKPLPEFLKDKFLNFKKYNFQIHRQLYSDLSEYGQKPRTMIISCCDSRVNPNSIFESEIGDHFIHRNIANLVPENSLNSKFCGTSAALEYATTVLNVSHVIVLGHSKCGGINACFDFFENNNQDEGFIKSWLEILRSTYNKLETNLPREQLTEILEKKSILNSLNNLLSYPFIRERVNNNKLQIHGVWQNIGSAYLEYYDNTQNKFLELK